MTCVALGVRAWGWDACNWHSVYAAGIICMMDPWISVAAVGLIRGTGADSAGYQLDRMRLRFFGQRGLKKASRFCKQCLSTETTFRAAKL